ncbi:DUF2993 domain-containing protein [Marinactinospora thermotolerans]|uniref:DUF2993 domain-containing protein n=1 Tax=Marinactinospora thermotolerans DSM 45154 TaxID=1122192 RepID=A0A1T4N0U6_9ACTN|nr:DUF2993 domain-containing protein [Marinactinospora thermotolerans]SJZ72980.1 Protein of unknown function [Marinactinospora thermotolerans DSM 45154]
MRKFLVFLIFLLVVLVAADRGLHHAAQSEIAKRVSQQYELASEPEVTIGGFPFLTQFFGGEYSEINIVTGAMTVNDVQLERVDATFTGVQAPLADLLSTPQVTAEQGQAKVMLPYSELQKRLPEGIVVETDNGTPRITGDLAVGGFSIPIESDIEITIDGDTLTMTPTNVSAGGNQIDLGSVAERLSLTVAVPPLPFDFQITGVEALPNGVELSGEGSDIPITGGGGQG